MVRLMGCTVGMRKMTNIGPVMTIGIIKSEYLNLMKVKSRVKKTKRKRLIPIKSSYKLKTWTKATLPHQLARAQSKINLLLSNFP